MAERTVVPAAKRPASGTTGPLASPAAPTASTLLPKTPLPKTPLPSESPNRGAANAIKLAQSQVFVKSEAVGDFFLK